MQILVVVANIQLRKFISERTLKAEVGKGFVSTVIEHELLGTKANNNLYLWKEMIIFLSQAINF